MAARMLPYLRNRPLVMERYPDGITGERIVQKNVPRYFPDWVTRTRVKKQEGTLLQVICDKPATLVYLANQACVEMHRRRYGLARAAQRLEKLSSRGD
jgi:bifunctional non-homologous end joining protein LigD